MALNKQSVTFNFTQGIDTKTDPSQVQFGKFVALDNSVFDKLGRLTKRNGYQSLTALPDLTYNYLTTFNGNLTAIGKTLSGYSTTSQGPGVWTSKGLITPLQLSTLTLIRNNTNQIQTDTAISPNGYVCVGYTDQTSLGSTTTQNAVRYTVSDVASGQVIVSPTTILPSGANAVFGAKPFVLGNNFVVVFTANSASSYSLKYFSINTLNPTTVGTIATLSSDYVPQSNRSFDGVVCSNTLFLSFNGGSGLNITALTQQLVQYPVSTVASASSTIIGVTQDAGAIYTAMYSSTTANGFIIATNTGLMPLFSQRQFVSTSSAVVTNLALAAQGGAVTLFYENEVKYNYSPNLPSNLIKSVSATVAGVLSSSTTLIRGVGLASKGFLINSNSYFMSAYKSTYQPSYFLMNSTGGVVAKLAYGNGSGYSTTGLPSANVIGSTVSVSYLVKDLLQAVNKDTNVATGTQTAGIYSQTGISLVKFDFGKPNLYATDLGNNLHVNGGMLWNYDGYRLTEHLFHLYPDDIGLAVNNYPGLVSAQKYFYRVTYEWTDNQGNIFRSAPSIPATITMATSSATSVTVQIPTMRLTYKTDNPVKLVIYRWSAAQQNYYQVTQIDVPLLNVLTSDSVAFTDYFSDAQILGNSLLYTEGGVVENVAPNASVATTIFDTRLWSIDAETGDLWFSKQVLSGTPVETSDLFTQFVSPSIGAQGPTGKTKCIFPMDDKLIIFKKNAIYYLNGTGPDNTGINSQYSQPTFITSTVGCENQNSIVMIPGNVATKNPGGLLFRSDKGIWLLGRDLSTRYLGKDVEAYNSNIVLSALSIPATNQVRFVLDSGITLMYDYFSEQWGTFSGRPAISSTLYQNLETYINAQGETRQENLGMYLDGTRPVCVSFTTGFISLAGLQGYKRIYRSFLLGQFQSPHRFTMGVAYDYDPSVQQLVSVIPDNYSGVWGSGTSWGSISTWGGNSAREQWQINFEQQQCQSFQLSFNEYYDSQYGVSAGAGLTISGVTLVAGVKSTFPQNIGAKNKAG